MEYDKELRRYVFNYYGEFLTEDEMKTWQSIIEESKTNNYDKRIIFSNKLKPTSKDKDIFYESTIKRILEEYKDEIIINRCTICGVLARTPKAKICRNGHKKEEGVWVSDPPLRKE